MENKKQKNGEQSFLSFSQQREHAERMDRLFVRAVGDEDVSRREANIKHFDLGANRYQAVVYSEPVHFRESEDGDWQEIDNTLEETVNAQGRPVLKNRANRMRVEFPGRWTAAAWRPSPAEARHSPGASSRKFSRFRLSVAPARS